MIDMLQQLVSDVLDEMGVELVELQFNRSKRSSVRVFVWQEGGIGIDRCTEISRKLSEVLDREDVIDGRYLLEISSPGIDRPMRSRRDFERQIGRLIKATVVEQETSSQLEARLLGVDDVGIQLETDEGIITLAFDKILTAKVLVEF